MLMSQYKGRNDSVVYGKSVSVVGEWFVPNLNVVRLNSTAPSFTACLFLVTELFCKLSKSGMNENLDSREHLTDTFVFIFFLL